ncbi:unnamed protein product, partial [Allacma fusca]
QLKIPKRLLLY